jgi:hypothetical protein
MTEINASSKSHYYQFGKGDGYIGMGLITDAQVYVGGFYLPGSWAQGNTYYQGLNGALSSTSLPFGNLENSGTDGKFTLGKIADRSNQWRGIVCEFFGFKGDITLDGAYKALSYLCHRWGVSVDPSNPYQTAPKV